MSVTKLIQHLLPRSEAWKSGVARNTTKLLAGFGEVLDEVREYYDEVFLDQFPATTRFISDWERELGLSAGVSEVASRANIAAAQRATGGQSPRYIQDVIHAAGFTEVFVHEPWATELPYVARDPRPHIEPQYYGLTQFAEAGADQAFFTEAINPQTFGANEQERFSAISLGSNYLDNDTLQQRFIPQVPEESQYWPFFIYFSGATFPEPAYVDPARKHELIRLILQLRPLHMWVVFLFTYNEDPVLTGEFLFNEGDGFNESIWA
jgi:uncharacterized protein YmfQ (DUF2313 family)